VKNPSIVSAFLAAGHDGLAEVAISLRYPNGAERTMSLPCESVHRALDAAGISTLDDLVGRPWTILLPEPARTTEPEQHSTPPHSSNTHATSQHSSTQT
jgi:hypothetical protein